MKKIIISLVLIFNTLVADEAYDAFIKQLNASDINKKTIWYSKYQNSQIYKTTENSLKQIKKDIRKYKKKRQYKKLSNLEQEKELKLNELELLKEYEHSSFGNLLRVKTIKDQPDITNPLDAISAMSFIQSLENEKSLLSENMTSLNENISEIVNRIEAGNFFMYTKEGNLSKEDIVQYKSVLNSLIVDLENFQTAKRSYQSIIRVYSKRTDDVTSILYSQIKSQIIKLLYIVLTIVIMILISYFIKVFLERYVSDHKNIYTANKAINVTTFIIIGLVLLFSYLENVTYLATVLGFASAGIAIAMRDWFMSILGWMVIVIGGSIHVGDRVRFAKSNQVYLGDVLDISMLRITLHETVTYTTYTTNRRAGRIVFVPNNFIFSSMISNYSHGGMKTVWDGLDITITFDSNHKKALFIAKEVAIQLSKGYTSIARKQLNLLRREYSLKTTQVDPQCFTLLESYGMRISIWYQTNSYATLVLRSTLSSAILERYQQEDDIQIAYKTQDINLREVPVAMDENV